MTDIIDQLTLYFQFSIVRYAMIVGILVALCASLLGVTLVLKRYSFIGMGLSNVAFGATAIAAAMTMIEIESIFIVLPITVISAILLLRTRQNSKVHGDAALAMIAVGSLAIGYLIMNRFPRTANLAGDVCTILFGSTSILTLRTTDLWVSVILSVLVVSVFIFFYHKIFAITFDEDFSSATGVRVKTYNLILSVIIAIVIVLAINLVGALLISALVIFPAMSAMRVFKTFKSVTICSVIVSTFCAAFGMITSMLPIIDTPVGSTIVAVNVVVFALFTLVGLIARKA